MSEVHLDDVTVDDTLVTVDSIHDPVLGDNCCGLNHTLLSYLEFMLKIKESFIVSYKDSDLKCLFLLLHFKCSVAGLDVGDTILLSLLTHFLLDDHLEVAVVSINRLLENLFSLLLLHHEGLSLVLVLG